MEREILQLLFAKDVAPEDRGEVIRELSEAELNRLHDLTLALHENISLELEYRDD